MANRVIDVALQLTDNFTGTARKSIEAMTSMSKAGVRVGKDIEKAGTKIASVGTALTTSITLPAVGAAAASVTSFGEVDKSIRLVAETMGDTKWAAADLEGAIKVAAANSVFSMQDAADASLNFARQGWDAAQSADMLTSALNLAAGTATNLDTVTGGLGNTLKAFNADASEATHYADMMAVAQAQANTDVTGLFEAMSIAGSTCNTVGWSFSELATLTGVFGDHSISASEGATALNTGLMRLAKPTKEASMALESLGINVFEEDGSLKNMADTIEVLQEGFAGLTDQEALSAASAIFGKNQASKWITLINGPGGQALTDLVANIDNASGEAQNMSDALLSGVGGSMEKMKSTLDVLKYSVGDLLAGTVQPFLDSITGLMDRFNSLDESQQKNIMKWIGIAAAVGPAILMFGKTVKTVGTCVRAFNTIGMAISNAGGIMALVASPVGIVIAAILGLVGVVLIVRQHWDTFMSVLQGAAPVWENIKAHISSIIERIQAIWAILQPVVSWIVNFLGQAIAGAAGAIVSVVAGVVEFITSHVDTVLAVVQGILEFFVGVFTGKWSETWIGVGQVFSDIWDGIVEVFKGVINFFIDGINKFIGGINSLQIPDWVPGVGGKSMNITLIPRLAKGTENWIGGVAQISEAGGEIVDLPRGSRVYPHDESVAMARREGMQAAGNGNTANSVTITGNSFYVRNEADIEKIGAAIVEKLKKASSNRGGWTYSADMA